MARRW